MRFIYQFPETTGTETGMLDVGPLCDVGVAAERAGFTGIALTEHPLPRARWLASGGHQSLDPLVALGYVAGATTTPGSGPTRRARSATAETLSGLSARKLTISTVRRADGAG